MVCVALLRRAGASGLLRIFAACSPALGGACDYGAALTFLPHHGGTGDGRHKRAAACGGVTTKLRSNMADSGFRAGMGGERTLQACGILNIRRCWRSKTAAVVSNVAPL